MKICPRCGSQYTDDTLRFCLQDGTPLGSMGAADTPTVTLGETETFLRPRERAAISTGEPLSEENLSQVTHVAAAPRSGNNIWAIAGIFAAIMLVAAIGVGIAVYLLFPTDPSAANAKLVNNSNLSSVSVTNATPIPSRSIASPTASRSTPIPSPTLPSTAVSSDTDRSRTDALRTVNAWKSSLESRDLNGYMAAYANTVDYYRRKAVSSSVIQADKARAFQLYDSMRVDISNESTAISQDGDRATVTFDKEWHFSGRSRSDGKTPSQLELANIGGRWLITAERDLQLYYKR